MRRGVRFRVDRVVDRVSCRGIVVVLRWNFLKTARVAINFFFSSLPFPSLTKETLRALLILL